MTSPRWSIRPWLPDDRDAVVAMIVGIQQGEFDLPITAADQPDLVDVDGFYRGPGGEFWVATVDMPAGRTVVGTIAAVYVDDNTVAIRKMFVDADHRGDGLAAALMETLKGWTRRRGHRTVLLGTTAAMRAAHRFYAKHGFREIDAASLPPSFPRMAVDSVFYRHDLADAVAPPPPNPD